MGHNAQFHKLPQPLIFDQCGTIIYFGDRVRIHYREQRICKVPTVDKWSALKTPIISFASTLGPRRIPLGCISRTGNVGRKLAFMGCLLWAGGFTTQLILIITTWRSFNVFILQPLWGTVRVLPTQGCNWFVTEPGCIKGRLFSVCYSTRLQFLQILMSLVKIVCTKERKHPCYQELKSRSNWGYFTISSKSNTPNYLAKTWMVRGPVRNLPILNIAPRLCLALVFNVWTGLISVL